MLAAALIIAGIAVAVMGPQPVVVNKKVVVHRRAPSKKTVIIHKNQI